MKKNKHSLQFLETIFLAKLYSLQRRRERYIIIYIWKITQHMVPNVDGTMGHKIKTRKQPRQEHSVSFSTTQTETMQNPFKKMQ